MIKTKFIYLLWITPLFCGAFDIGLNINYGYSIIEPAPSTNVLNTWNDYTDSLVKDVWNPGISSIGINTGYNFSENKRISAYILFGRNHREKDGNRDYGQDHFDTGIIYQLKKALMQNTGGSPYLFYGGRINYFGFWKNGYLVEEDGDKYDYYLSSDDLMITIDLGLGYDYKLSNNFYLSSKLFIQHSFAMELDSWGDPFSSLTLLGLDCSIYYSIPSFVLNNKATRTIISE